MKKEYILEEKYGNYKHEYIQFDKKKGQIKVKNSNTSIFHTLDQPSLDP